MKKQKSARRQLIRNRPQPSAQQGHALEAIFIIKTGTCKVVKAIPLSHNSDRIDTVVDIERLHHGDFFGEEALFRDISVSGFDTSLVSETYVEALVISPDLFKTTIKFWPTLRFIKEYSITKQAARDTEVLQHSIVQARNWEHHKRDILSVTCAKTFKVDPPQIWQAQRRERLLGRKPTRPKKGFYQKNVKSPRVSANASTAGSSPSPSILKTRVWEAPVDEQEKMSKTA